MPPAVWMALAVASAGEVRFDGARWPLLRPPEAERSSGPPPPLAMPGRIVVEPDGDDLMVRHRIPVLAPSAGFVVLPLAERGFTLGRALFDGRDVPVRFVDGAWHAAFRVDAPGTLVVEGLLPGRTSTLTTPTGGELEVRGDVEAVGVPSLASGRYAVPRGRVALQPQTDPSGPGGTLVLGEVGTGLTVRDATVVVRAGLRWQVARGSLDAVRFGMAAVPPDLEVTGENVASVQKRRGAVIVRLARSATRSVELEATWTVDAPAASRSTIRVPLPRLANTFRDTTAVQVARDTDREVLPGMLVGHQPVLSAALPDWARGRVDGAPIAAFFATQAAEAPLTLLQTTPAPRPPTVIEAAESLMATNAEGAVVMTTRLAVRNERSAFLTVTAPPGARLVNARVKGRTALVTPQSGGRYLVPLARSVQSVEGSLSFPVELAFVGRTAAWPRRGPMTVPLPTVDAPVAVHRTRLHLPPGYRPQARQPAAIVDAFSDGQGINFGYASPTDRRIGQAQAIFDQAVESWLANDFEVSQGYVDQLDAMGAQNADVERLRSNLDVVSGSGNTGVAEARRLKSLARARADRDLIAQKEKVDEADAYLAKGDYENAQQSYQSALQIGDRLQRIAAEEDFQQRTTNQNIRDKLGALGVDEVPADAPVTLPPLQVRAGAPAVRVPQQDTRFVKHQRRLVPAGETPQITVAVTSPRRNR